MKQQINALAFRLSDPKTLKAVSLLVGVLAILFTVQSPSAGSGIGRSF